VTPAEAAGDAEPISAVVPGADRAPTGDPAVDQVLRRLDAVTGEPLDAQIEVAEQVHGVLQGRLADLGQE
jgi:hypothetical protein